MSLNGLIRKGYGKIYGEQLVLDANKAATPTHSPLFLFPTGAPTNAAKGSIYVNSSTNTLEVHNGTDWQSIASLARKIYHAATTLTAADSGALCIFDTAAGFTYTLPAAAEGLHFDFLVNITITSAAARVECATGDFLLGSFIQSTDGTYTSAAHEADGAADLAWSGNGTTTGGLIGDWLHVSAISDTQWAVYGMGRATGAEATPFLTS